MLVNSISGCNTNFKAKFVNDSKGLYEELKNLYRDEKITKERVAFSKRLRDIGKGNELEIVLSRGIIRGKKCGGGKIIRVHNKSNDRVEDFLIWSKGRPFWGQLMGSVVESNLFS